MLFQVPGNFIRPCIVDLTLLGARFFSLFLQISLSLVLGINLETVWSFEVWFHSFLCKFKIPFNLGQILSRCYTAHPSECTIWLHKLWDLSTLADAECKLLQALWKPLSFFFLILLGSPFPKLESFPHRCMLLCPQMKLKGDVFQMLRTLFPWGSFFFSTMPIN